MGEKQNKVKSLIGIISDTHGLLRPEALDALQGANLILHAGDVGGPEVLEALKGLAPVVAIRGNNDRGEWADELPDCEVVAVGTVHIYMLHNVKEIDLNPATAGFRVVISGHSHKPSVAERQGVLYVNPGSAGPRRFSLPVSVARLSVDGETAIAELVELSVRRPA